jgi:hypothetical protein
MKGRIRAVAGTVLLICQAAVAAVTSGVVETCVPCRDGVSAAGFDFSKLQGLDAASSIPPEWTPDVKFEAGGLRAVRGIVNEASLNIVMRHAVDGVDNHDSVRLALDSLREQLRLFAPLAGYSRDIDHQSLVSDGGCFFVRTNDSLYALLVLARLTFGGLNRYLWYWALQDDGTAGLYDDGGDPSHLSVVVHAFSGRPDPCFVFGGARDRAEIEAALYRALNENPWPDSTSGFEFPSVLGYRGLTLTGLAQSRTALSSYLPQVHISGATLAVAERGKTWVLPDSRSRLENLVIARGRERDLQSSCNGSGGAAAFRDVTPDTAKQQWMAVGLRGTSESATPRYDISDIAVTPGRSSDSTRVIFIATRQKMLLKAEAVFHADGSTTPGTFRQVSGLDIAGVRMVESRNDTVYLGTTDRGVLRSTDGGNAWTPFHEGLPALPGLAKLAPIQSLRIFGQKLYATVEDAGSLYVTELSRASWRHIPTEGRKVQAFAVRPGEIVTGTDRGALYRSVDNGTHWQPLPLEVSGEPWAQREPWKKGAGEIQLGDIVLRDNLIYLSVPIDCMICSNPASIKAHLLVYRRASDLWYPILENLCCRHDLSLQPYENSMVVGHFPYPSSRNIDTSGQFIAILSETGGLRKLEVEIPDSAWYAMRVIENDLFVGTSAGNVYRYDFGGGRPAPVSAMRILPGASEMPVSITPASVAFDLRGRRIVGGRRQLRGAGVYIQVAPDGPRKRLLRNGRFVAPR